MNGGSRRLRALVGAVLAVAILLPCAPPVRAAPAVTVAKHILPNGLTVLIKENPSADLVAAEVLVRAGPRVEEPGQAGIALLVREVMLRGTERRSQADIALALEGVGGVLRVGTSVDYTELSLVALSRHADVALDVLADLVMNAKFDPAEIEAQRRNSLARIRLQADQPLNRVIDLLTSRLYAFHPYANPILGTTESVSSLTRDQVVSFYRTFYTAPNMVVVIAGNLPVATALDKVRRAFGSVRAEPLPHRIRLLPAVERALAPRPAERREVREERRTSAAWIAVGYMSVEIGHRDWAALRVLNAMLGEGLSSRLFVEIREKQGLAYQVGSVFPTRAGPSNVILFAGTDPPNLPKVTDGLLREVARLQETLSSAEELERAKQGIIGRHAIDHENLQRQAFLLGFYELLGAGFGFDARLPDLVSAVQAEDVQRVARLYLQHPTIAVVAPPGR